MIWKRVEDELPPIDQEVLTLWDGFNHAYNKPARYFVIAGLCEDGTWMDGEGNDVNEPTHWMPLPEPPA